MDERTVTTAWMDGAPDADLISAVGKGCERSFRILFGRWGGRLGGFLLRATGSRETGEDLLQEAFLRIIRAAPRFDPRGDAGAWMIRICANLAYSHWRRERRSPFREPPAGVAEDRTAPRDPDDPESIRIRSRFAREAAGAIRRLPPNHRLVFLLKIDQGLTYEQIGSVLRCPTGTAKSRFHHAVRRLRSDLSAWADGIGSVAPRRGDHSASRGQDHVV